MFDSKIEVRRWESILCRKSKEYLLKLKKKLHNKGKILLSFKHLPQVIQDNILAYNISITNITNASDEEITEYLKSFYPEQNLNFEKEIKGTVYKVNTYFNKDGEHTILTRFFEIFQK